MIKFRFYYDKDAEERWLTKMDTRGYKLEGFFLGFYSFSKCEPGEYNYQIDMLDSVTGRSLDYKEFMEETGVEVVAQWYRWVYLRRKKSDGPFELYTDKETKLEQYQKITRFFTGLFILEAVCFVLELMAALETKETLFICFTIFILIVMSAFLHMIFVCRRKIEELEDE